MILSVNYVDIIILIITAGIMGSIIYFKFFKKNRSHCSGCCEVAKAKRTSNGIKKFYEKQKRMEIK